MELIYYWINKKKCIHEQGFCFSPEYNISMLKVEQGKYELKISRKKENNVFLSDVISNITVLVGDNGAGKTTLLKELWSLRCYPCENEDREEYQEFNKNENEKNKNLIILKKDDGQLYLYTNIYQKNIQIQGEIIKSIFYLSDYSSIASEFIRTSGEYFGFTKIYISNSYFDDLNGMSTNGKLDELAITPARLFFISSAFFEFICPDKTYNEKVNDFGRYSNWLKQNKDPDEFQQICDLMFYNFLIDEDFISDYEGFVQTQIRVNIYLAFTRIERAKMDGKIQESLWDIVKPVLDILHSKCIREDNESIVNSIKHNKNIKNIDIFLTDPIMFDSATEVEVGDTPISRIGTTMHTILYDIYKELEKDQSINIYFIPLVQLDHMVFVDDLLLLRHTLLWTNDSHYKATPLICKRIDKNSTLDRIIVNSAMYNVYAEYINRLKTDSMVIEIKQYGNSAKNETKAKKSHREWRERLYYLRKSKKLKGQIIMHKLYRSQLISDLHSTWDPRFRSFSAEINWGDEGESGFFNPDKLDGKIDSPDKLYDASNLLNDDTQKILLPYIKETEHLLNGMVKRYDKCGEAHIFPSLDVGFPNNILRLAGGFATGMLVVWKSGTPLVPVDTTVNVCSSSYYEFDESALKGRKVSDFFNQKIIQNIINKGSVKEGLAFSFNTGNHFILLSKSRNTGHYFLVLHSSAKQYKDTYLGLYPKPHNWYSNLIKTYQEKGSDRYIHYLKDDEALRFISIARSLNEQNRDIHNWFASEIFGDIKPIQQKTYHHYGMPTDYSIAIGTYVVDERDVVPIFSREGYPIFLFRPSSNMWSIVLEGKTKYIIPHGWGQELRYDYFAKQIQKEDFKNGKLSIKNGKFVLSNSQHGYYEKKFDIDYSARFNKKQVGVRDLYKTDKFDGKNIFGDTPYIKGTIEEILDPVALFSSDTEGAVKYYVSGEEN